MMKLGLGLGLGYERDCDRKAGFAVQLLEAHYPTKRTVETGLSLHSFGLVELEAFPR
jgi:hypothetical protein